MHVKDYQRNSNLTNILFLVLTSEQDLVNDVECPLLIQGEELWLNVGSHTLSTSDSHLVARLGEHEVVVDAGSRVHDANITLSEQLLGANVVAGDQVHTNDLSGEAWALLEVVSCHAKVAEEGLHSGICGTADMSTSSYEVCDILQR